MEARRQNQSNNYYNRTNYVEGNTVRKLNAVPDIRREVQREEVTTSPRRQERSQPKALSGISFGSLVVLTFAIITTLYVCIEYLKVQTDVSQMEKEIINKEHNLASLKKENDATYELISEKYDLAYVYEVAVGELGMVYPNKNTVISFQKNPESFVTQYGDIPKAKEKSLLDLIINK